MDFCFSCRAQVFISSDIELRSMLSLEFWSSYFSEYLWLIAVPKSSHRRCSKEKLFLKILQYSQENTRIKKIIIIKLEALRPVTKLKRKLQHRCFSVNFMKFLKAPILKNSERLLLCTSPVSSTIIFQIHTELLLHVQPSLLSDIFYIISLDNKI